MASDRNGVETSNDGTTSYTWEQIKEVQSLIERCMQHYMTQTEIIATLQVQADIDPALTCLVWQKLEEQNRNYFMSYTACLRLKDQIVAFNYLVEQQTRLLQKLTLSIPHNLQLNNNSANWTSDAQQQQALQQQQQLHMVSFPGPSMRDSFLRQQQQQQQQQQQVSAPAGAWAAPERT